MSDSKSPTNYALNLIVLGIAIIIVLVIQNNLNDFFVGRVPQVPIGNAPYYNLIPYGVYPNGQPMVYPQQMYPAKLPYYNDSVANYGRPCKEPDGCGVLGACVDGVCKVKDQNNTVFDIKI